MTNLCLLHLLSRLVSLCLMAGQAFSIKHIGGLSYFETVEHVNRQSRVKKRSTESGVDRQDYIKFQAFNRTFEIVLKPGTDVLANGFQAKVIHANGRAERFHVDVNQFFSGHLVDDPEVKVTGHMEGTMIALIIYDYDDMYAVEPTRIYMTGKVKEREKDKTWVVYRYGDTRSGGKAMSVDPPNISYRKFCGSESEPETIPINRRHFDRQNVSDDNIKRTKRALKKNTCAILAVATYDLYRDRCIYSYFHCANYIADNVRFADNVLKTSDLGEYSGLRIKLKEMLIFNSQTRYTKSYNEEYYVPWECQKLLSAFHREVSPMSHKFCYTFLFTAHRIENTVLGLAYSKSTCSRHNAAFLTIKSSDSSIVTSLRNHVLFAHGHVLGSGHDPPSCVQPSNRGGNYIMWSFVLDGRCDNCRKYSKCTTNEITNYMKNDYARFCFQDSSKEDQSFCGNGVLEKGEECDEGFYSKDSDIPMCCDDKCRLKPGAFCSDHNHVCCINCLTGLDSDICLYHLPGTCFSTTYCREDSLECPASIPIPDKTPCKQNGKCFNGECMDFCSVMGQELNKKIEPCMCETDVISGCKLCCFDASDPKNPGECKPYSNATYEDNRPCYIGQCINGVCQLASSKNFFFYNLISGFDLTKGAKFMRNNIVTTVIVLSLILWIPACYTISIIDSRLLMMLEDEERLLVDTGDPFVQPGGYDANLKSPFEGSQNSINKPTPILKKSKVRYAEGEKNDETPKHSGQIHFVEDQILDHQITLENVGSSVDRLDVLKLERPTRSPSDAV